MNFTVLPERAANDPDANLNTIFGSCDANSPVVLRDRGTGPLQHLTNRNSVECTVNVDRSQVPSFLTVPLADRQSRNSRVLQQTIGNAAGVLKADNGPPIPIACRLSIGAVYDATERRVESASAISFNPSSPQTT